MNKNDSYKMRYLFGYEQHDLVLLLMLITTFLVMIHQNKVNKLQRFVRDPIFIGNLFLMSAFSLWIIYFNRVEDARDDKDKNTRIKLRHSLFIAIIAFIIALCAAFELVILPFWIIWISSFYFDIS